jgi:predicted metal-dependent phosphoesterase TrpH
VPEFVDLHSHSTASDGTLAPADVARLAARSNLSGFALTDHDTIEGLAEAAAESATLGITFLPGIEISCIFPHPGTLHLLGYRIDPQSPSLTSLAQRLIDGRNARNPQIVNRLRELGVAITMEEVEAEAGGNVIGRPHMAAILVRKGYVSSIKEAFNKYLAPGGSAYFDKEVLTPREAIDLIKKSGGIPVLAHPIQLRTQNDGQLETILKNLLDLGLAGIEVIHSDHSPAEVDKYAALAERYKLLKTGGSDFHGGKKPGIELGLANGRRIPRAFLDALLAYQTVSLTQSGTGGPPVHLERQ